MKSLEDMFGKYARLVVSANIIAFLLGGVIVWLAYWFGQSDQTYPLNFLLCVIGVLLGWILGILASPLSGPESAKFVTLGQAISAFATGYLVSKVDRFFEVVMYAGDGLRGSAWIRFGLFIASLLLFMIIVFVNRSYLHAAARDETAVSAMKRRVKMQRQLWLPRLVKRHAEGNVSRQQTS